MNINKVKRKRIKADSLRILAHAFTGTYQVKSASSIATTVGDIAGKYIRNREAGIRSQEHAGQTDDQNTKKETSDLPPVSIGIKDFVLRGNSFFCRHEGHDVTDLDARISVIDQQGNLIETMIHAAYCRQCNLYFILESVYERLRMLGIPACRVSDEKTYRAEYRDSKDMNLKAESLLMQYGYNVSQKEELPASIRQRILSQLVDHNIMTKNDILNYLNFFIAQNRRKKDLTIAIQKWTTDREFINGYRIGTFTQVKVGSITRKN